MKNQIEINSEFKRGLELMENTRQNVFITGKAGSGKSTLLNYFRKTTAKEIAILAPTGVAAVNVAGQTIHSFFGFKPNIVLSKVRRNSKLAKILVNLDALVIDEISMVRADLLDCLDKSLRLNLNKPSVSFGGLQMIFIGDLYQLSPVVVGRERKIFRTNYQSEYFFDSFVFKESEFAYLELEKIYRQSDPRFINILNKVRNNSIGPFELEVLNNRCDPDFKENPEEFYVHLTPTNQASHEVNKQRLKELSGSLYHFQGEISGNFSQNYFPTELDLYLKKKAQVMLLNNDKQGRWINGTMARIRDIVSAPEFEDKLILIELENGNQEEVLPFTWHIFKFFFNERTGQIESQIVGSFKQYPLKLAWSITIHKSQGKTFNRVIIDMGRGAFAFGQVYVALSRCVGLDGIILKKPIQKKHILMDWRVVKFITNYQYYLAKRESPLERKADLIQKAIDNKKKLEIVYLKSDDTKSKRVILPCQIREMEYLGRKFPGIKAFCYQRGEERVFRTDRILEIKAL